MFESDFLALMRSTCQLAPRTGHDADGRPTWGSNTSYRCRFVRKHHFIRGRGGETIEASGVVWVASTGEVQMTDRITLPDGSSPPVVNVTSYPDEDGPYHHTKLILGY